MADRRTSVRSAGELQSASMTERRAGVRSVKIEENLLSSIQNIYTIIISKLNYRFCKNDIVLLIFYIHLIMNIKSKCQNITQAKQYIRNKLLKYNHNDFVHDSDIIQLLPFHPTKHINIDTIDYLIMKKRLPYNKLALFYKYKNSDVLDDISYMLCIENLYGKYCRNKHYEKDVITAFRNESHFGTKKQFFVKNTYIDNNKCIGICNHCNLQTHDITTDHYPVPYKQIFDSFIKNNNIVLSNIDIFENDKNILKIQSEDLASEWKLYHDDIAQYRLLCKSCNCHFGSYGI